MDFMVTTALDYPNPAAYHLDHYYVNYAFLCYNLPELDSDKKIPHLLQKYRGRIPIMGQVPK